MNDKRVEIRAIYDINNNVYDIFDLQYLDNWNRWISKGTYFTIEDVFKFEPNVLIIDSRPEERKKEIPYKF